MSFRAQCCSLLNGSSIALPALLVAAMLLAACSDDPVSPDPDPSVTGVTVTPEELDLFMDESAVLGAEVHGDEEVSQEVTWSSSDEEVATVNASGEVTPVWPGTATIVATSVADASVSGEATLQTTCREPEQVTSSITADETWTAQGGGCVDYIVTDQYNVRATLTIEPGTIVAFEAEAGLHVRGEGTLLADGTAEAPILLTGTEEERGWWDGIYIDETESTDHLLNHVTIEYGGQDDPANQYNPGFALRIGGPSATSGQQDSDVHYATVTNTTLRQSAGYGLFIRGNAEVEFANNTLTENALGAARVVMQAADVFDEASEFAGNDRDLIMLTHGTWEDAALVNPGDGIRYLLGSAQEDPDNAWMNVSASLTIDPGVVVSFTYRSDLTIEEEGRLIAEGTEAEPILFTGEESVPGFWGGLAFDGSSNNSLDYVTVEYGGDRAGANLATSSASAAITNSTFRYAGENQYGQHGYGLWVNSTSAVNPDVCEVNAFEGNAAADCYIEEP